MSKLIEGICFQCDEVGKLLKGQTTCIHCDSLNRKNDYLSGEFNGDLEITAENINLYYEFMNDDDLIKYFDLISTLIHKRTLEVRNLINFNPDENFNKYRVLETLRSQAIGQTVFGVKDLLKPIDIYVSEIKQSEQYKTYMANN